MKDVIIDFETLGTVPNAVCLSLGMAVIDADAIDPDNLQESFDNIVKTGMHWKLDVSSQVKDYGRAIQADTVAWWGTQGESASAVLKPMSTDILISDLPDKINQYLKDSGYTKGKCYTRGMIDSTWLQSLCVDVNQDVNIKWWDYRDVRTFVDCMTGSTNGYLPKDMSFNPTGLIKHNALHDCALDIVQMYIAAVYEPDDLPF